MSLSLSSKPDGTASRDMDIKKEEGDSSRSQSREEPPAQLAKGTTSYTMKMTTPKPSYDSSLSSVTQDLIKNEDDVSHTGSGQHMRTRQTSRLATATSVFREAATPEVLPQVRSDVEQSQPKNPVTTTQDEPTSGKYSQEDYKSTEQKKELRQTKAQLRKQLTKLSSAEQIVRQLKEELKKEKEKVKIKRDEYRKKIKSGPITMGDDGQMRTLLSRLGDMCKDWAAKYAIPDKAGRTYTDAEKSSILGLLKLRFKAVSDHGEATIFDGMTNCAELLLNAALTHLIWFEILNRPFYFVEHSGTAEAPAGVEEALKWLVQLGDLSGNVAQKLTYCWVGTLLKSLNPTTTAEADGPLEKAARSKNKIMKDAAFRGLENVLKRHCGILLNEATEKEAKKRDDRLWHICRQAHELSFKLWTQGYKIKCFSRTMLLAQFENKSDIMQAHLTMLIDDTDTSRDGEEVYLVTKPCIKAYGNENGEFAQAIRVLNPATVSIATKEDLEWATRARAEAQKQQNYGFVRSGNSMNGVQEVAQRSIGKAIEQEASTSGTKKQLAASGFSGGDASPAIARGDASLEAQARSNSLFHGPDPATAKNDHGAPSQQTQNSSENTGICTYLQDDDNYYEQVNVKTGKRKRVVMYFGVFDDDDVSAESSTGGANNDEPPSKKIRNRKRGRGGQKEAANKLESPEKANAPVQVK